MEGGIVVEEIEIIILEEFKEEEKYMMKRKGRKEWIE